MWKGLCETRKHVRTWSDASGVDGIVCVFLLVDEAWHYSTTVVPEAIISQLLPRRNLQIVLFELLAPI